MNLQELYTYCREVIEKYPELRDEVMQHFALAEMESEDDCSSEEHECELSYTDIDALLEQFETQEEKDIKNGLYGEEY